MVVICSKRTCSWLKSLILQLLQCDEIPSSDHLVKEKVKPMNLHLATDCIVSAKPCVGLLGNRRIEVPCLCTNPKEFRIGDRVAVFLTKHIALAMLALEVENVNG